MVVLTTTDVIEQRREADTSWDHRVRAVNRLLKKWESYCYPADSVLPGRRGPFRADVGLPGGGICS